MPRRVTVVPVEVGQKYLDRDKRRSGRTITIDRVSDTFAFGHDERGEGVRVKTSRLQRKKYYELKPTESESATPTTNASVAE